MLVTRTFCSCLTLVLACPLMSGHSSCNDGLARPRELPSAERGGHFEKHAYGSTGPMHPARFPDLPRNPSGTKYFAKTELGQHMSASVPTDMYTVSGNGLSARRSGADVLHSRINKHHNATQRNTTQQSSVLPDVSGPGVSRRTAPVQVGCNTQLSKLLKRVYLRSKSKTLRPTADHNLGNGQHVGNRRSTH